MPLKIAMIGAGSVGFTRRLMTDLLAVPEFAATHFALMDISERNLGMVTQLCQRDIAANDLPATLQPTLDQREAIADADYVICMIRQGGLDAFQLDIDIPLRYGIDQCVGDTICAGGIMYGQRTIPALLGICRDIRQAAKPGALFLNYANPMAMNTWACNQYGGVRTIGLCHGVQHGHQQIADCIQLWAREQGHIGAEETVSRDDVDIICAGINHQTWYISVRWRGMDMLPRLLELFEAHPVYREEEKVRIDVLRRFGYYSTESNGHLSEYLPWYRKRLDEIGDWISLNRWIHGETGGYLRVCSESRNWFETDFPTWLEAAPPQISPARRSLEHGSYIIEGLETGRRYRGHFNVPNRGHIRNLPDGCVVEIPGYADANGINMPVVGELPLAPAATCSASVRVQQMAMEAAVHGDVTLLKQAMLHDPLVGAVCNPEEVWQLTDEMLVAQAQWLPNYDPSEIAAAQQRLEQHEATGTRVTLRETRGAARLQTRSVEELRAAG
ncbi:MAG: alpha-glucosidase/alpha-galactosidase [Chloroflexi bacterium]|nr:alpha-glucosidase/alpha-galactosidase [Chloroflexota bacterium]MCY3582639.1 alpha-glucosidase/alpha-galactosidase [Chloroflexota bacterium]MCY3715437.1 alpha-glucosidase/alpha-galactosidase [Chloroflexota bacterium]MDE2650720.1 alpha-glucosidase/alpha-galactosidase [Chloroflexota bacterium]MXV94096.1 alpha-glucosidase/alpha-galactosidase [Chloroflexota bacterium]